MSTVTRMVGVLVGIHAVGTVLDVANIKSASSHGDGACPLPGPSTHHRAKEKTQPHDRGRKTLPDRRRKGKDLSDFNSTEI